MSAAERELLVLRHERRVLRRGAGGAAWRPGDRLWPTALSRYLPFADFRPGRAGAAVARDSGASEGYQSGL